MEQAEYEREAIQWSFVHFPDNQDCLDLIEGRKPDGVLAMLDDECNNPSGQDSNYVQRLYKALEQHPRFSASKLHRPKGQFCVHHYAGAVTYSTEGFR